MRPTLPQAFAAVVLGLAPSCGREARAAEPVLPSVVEIDAHTVLLERDGAKVVNGGYGSALALDPNDPGRFYLLTDRGPNVDVADRERAKRLLVPGFVPTIGRFRLDGDHLALETTIELEDAGGRRLTGRPPGSADGAAVESGFDPDGAPLEGDPSGVDPEGLVALPDGTFWVSEEYGPSILHVSASGRTLERIDARAGGGRRLPRVLARRRANRGMEGLTITPDGRALVGVMQAALDNPTSSAGKASRATRIVAFDLATGRTRQFLYLREEPHHSCSEIAALTSDSFLVLERDGRTPNDPSKPSRHISVWRVDLADATDVGDPDDSEAGRRIGGRTLEECSPEELEKAGVRAGRKTEVLNLLERGYPHDKPEGLAVIGDRTIAVSNDDDFGIVAAASAPAGFATKWLAGDPKVADHGTVRFYRLASPLR
ncbi:MAG TPA: esterase-like activity of phytase family protein [Planctomycetota bacterium]|nr:esterase-like activity of phytase family protein [Planctomycetota bacterium]